MKNTFWEELSAENINSNINNIHEEILSEMDIPLWMRIKCPFCGKEQPLRSIRSFGVKLNPRNVGDLFVEICCYDCKLMDTLYFRGEITKVSDFVSYLNGSKTPESSPVIEEDMYKMQYNNMIEKMLTKMNTAKNIKKE